MEIEDNETIAPSETDDFDERDELELEHKRELELERERERQYQRQRRRERYQSATLEIDADDPYFLGHDTFRPVSAGSESNSGSISASVSASWRGTGTFTPVGAELQSSIGADRRVRPATRRNVSRACEQCRGRKSKCSGEYRYIHHPRCGLAARRTATGCRYYPISVTHP
jgi:hypothetical protein